MSMLRIWMLLHGDLKSIIIEVSKHINKHQKHRKLQIKRLEKWSINEIRQLMYRLAIQWIFFLRRELMIIYCRKMAEKTIIHCIMQYDDFY